MQNDGHVRPVTSLQVAQPRLVLTAPPLPSCLSRVGQCGFYCHKYALYYKKWNSACAVRRDAWARKSDKLPACKILCCASRVMTMDKSGAGQRAIVSIGRNEVAHPPIQGVGLGRPMMRVALQFVGLSRCQQFDCEDRLGIVDDGKQLERARGRMAQMILLQP